MVQKLVSYKVDEDAIEAAKLAIKEFIEGIRKHESQTNYHAYQISEDKSQFIHLMVFPDNAAEEKHRNAEYTKKFVHDLLPLCEQEPKFSDIEIVADTLGDGVVDWAND